jgi:hypothetical protein
VRNAVRLPDDKVLFRLGNNQACLPDIEIAFEKEIICNEKTT